MAFYQNWGTEIESDAYSENDSDEGSTSEDEVTGCRSYIQNHSYAAVEMHYTRGYEIQNSRRNLLNSTISNLKRMKVKHHDMIMKDFVLKNDRIEAQYTQWASTAQPYSTDVIFFDDHCKPIIENTSTLKKKIDDAQLKLPGEKKRKNDIEEEKRRLEEQKHKEENERLEEENRKREIEKQKQCDSTNTNIRERIIRGQPNTFTEITLNEPTEFLVYHTIDKRWAHYMGRWNENVATPSHNGMHESFLSYYEEGKVPFFTKCPRCQSPTKFNYLHSQYFGGGVVSHVQNSHAFKDIYCDKHYFYDSATNKHYMENPAGTTIEFVDPYIIPNRPSWVTDGTRAAPPWRPSFHNIKWKEWDPSDPDGKKAAREQKQKEADNIQKEIVKLQIMHSEKLRELELI
jgi:hypothetical protein